MSATVIDYTTTISKEGFLIAEALCPLDICARLFEVSQRRSKELLDALGDREIGIGSANGYIEIVQRSKGRWDVPISPEEFGYDVKDLPWWPLAAKLLGDDAEHSFTGVVSSKPDSPAQEWHIDSPHESAEHLPLHAINFLIALEDIPLEMGPTEIAIGSHLLTNHLANPELNVKDLLYQGPDISPAVLVRGRQQDKPKTCTSALKAGTVVVFDDRILHRGLGNSSLKTRHVAYFSYQRKGYTENTHFESQRSVYDNH